MHNDTFRFRTPIQLRFSDADAMGHINNAKFFVFFEVARLTYFKEAVKLDMSKSASGMILASTAIDYLKPMLLTDQVFVYCRCSKIGNKSFEMQYKIVRESTGGEEVLATGSSVQVAFDYVRQVSVPVPVEWKEKISRFEEQTFA